ncbi:PucR family transcriptional regulator [uncultured Selenomonas sp.]|uniref:PucR family transcriptional regulator n=1 Tax=uncultured Selenomonas sp. TaxID=159275 RepID=UPI002804D5C3|nr:PucR family transcriptional regulator [uncultured Selenomonas sp.]
MLRCKDLKSLPSLGRLRYLTGTRGLENPIRWIYTPEDDDFTDWVHGGELLIVSGAASHRPAFNLSRVLREAVRLNLAGAILLFGEHYIEEIPRSIIDAAARKDFPLMTIPWDTPLVDIEESIARAIVLSDRAPQQESLLALALAGRVSAQEFAARAASAGYPVHAPQALCAFSFLPENAGGRAVEALTQETAQALAAALSARALPFLSCSSLNQIYLLFAAADGMGKEAAGARQAASTAEVSAAGMAGNAGAARQAAGASAAGMARQAAGDAAEKAGAAQHAAAPAGAQRQAAEASAPGDAPSARAEVSASAEVKAAAEAVLAELYSLAHARIKREECCAGATLAPALGDIIILYHEARTALDIARGQHLHTAPYVYEHGGLAELIVGSSMTEHFRSFANGLLAPLAAQDARSHGRLMETLAAFVAANGNVLHAAEQLYIHRNTLKYRLRQIEKALGGSLDDPDLRLKLQLALYIRRLLG